MTKNQLGASVILGACAILGAVAFFGFSPFVKTLTQFAGTSPVGTTFNTAKVAAISWVPQSNAATSTSILNTDANARVIKDTFVYCNNFGTSPSTGNASAVTVKSATTTTNSLGLQGSVNYASNFTFSTSTLDVYSATSTEGVITGTSRVWPSGTYLTFNMNASSTAGVCTVGSDYAAT